MACTSPMVSPSTMGMSTISATMKLRVRNVSPAAIRADESVIEHDASEARDHRGLEL